MAGAAVPRQPRDSMGTNMILKKGKGGMQLVRADGKQSYFQLEEPVWTSDKNVSVCSTCGDKFSFVVRKHHCRRSGIVLCDRCCVTIPLERFAYMDPVRVCAWWKDQCEYESEFFAKSLPTLRSGAVFTIEHDGKRYPGVDVGLSDTDDRIVFTAEGGKPWEVVAELPVQTIHMKDDKGLTLTTKRTGEITLLTEDKDTAKRWRKAIKKMIKVLHGKPKATIPKEFPHMRLPSGGDGAAASGPA